MKALAHSLLISAAFMTSACSNHYRTVGQSMASEDVLESLDELVSSSSGSGLFSQLAQDTRTVIYYAEGPALAPAESIVAMRSYEFLGLDIASYELTFARVFFLDGYDGEGEGAARVFSLAIEVSYDERDEEGQSLGEQTAVAFFDSDDAIHFSRNQFTAKMSGTGGSIELYSFDVIPGRNELARVIQLRIATSDYDTDQLLENGKINHLVGITR